MNTRSFIKSLLLAAVAPTVFLPTEPVRWKRKASLLMVPNPEWVTAPGELGFYFAPNQTFPMNMGNTITRYVNRNGRFVRVERAAC